MEYLICFQKVYFDESTQEKTKEFSAPNNKAALKIYEDFCRQARNSSNNFVSAYPTGLFRIIQREIKRRVSRRR